MGNYNCCKQKKTTKKCVRIKSIRTSTSFQYEAEIFQKKNLLPQFIENYSQALQFLQKNRGYFQLTPPCFTVSIQSKIGKGAHSEVYLVKTDYQTNFMEMAMKVIPKQKLKTESLQKSCAMQNIILLHNKCPFLMKSYMCRQDQNNIYFFTPVAPGGDLLSFSEQCTGKGEEFLKNQESNLQFILAGIILGLQYLHNMGIILNDLKLENILIDKEGYPIITDFGLIEPQNTDYFQQVVGTMTYFSPDKIYSPQYTRAVDFWALGILIYTLVYRQFPFDRELIQCGNFLNQIRAKQYKHKKMSSKGSNELKDLINALLVENPQQRLGYEDINDLKQHKFFKNFNWQQYQTKSMKSPLKPIIEKYPLKPLNQLITTNRVKIFRQSNIQDQYLYTIQSTLRLKRSMCSTADRLSNNHGSSQYIPSSPLYKTCVSYGSPSKLKSRKKSVSFELGV